MTTWSLIFVIIWIVFLLVFVKKSLQIAILAFVLVRQSLFSVPSLIFIVNGGYINEQNVYGHDNGAIIIYVFHIIYSLLLIYILFKYLHIETIYPGFKIGRFKIENQIILIAIGVLTILIINLALSPIPLFNSEVDRFDYFRSSKFPFLRTILGDVASFVPFIFGIYFTKKRKPAIILFSVYMIYIVLIGQKFGPLISSITYFFIPFICMHDFKIKYRSLFKVQYLLIPAAIFGVVYYSYSVYNPYKHVVGDSVVAAIFYRLLGLQSHVWWGSVEHFVYMGKPPSYQIMELADGMRHMMSLLAPFDVSLNYQRGVSFTNAYPGILLKVFPYHLAFVFNTLMIVKLTLMIKLLVAFIKSKNYLLSIILFQAYIWFIYMLSMGTFARFWITTAVLLVLLMMVKVKLFVKKPELIIFGN